jgi:hypothetical protein
MEERIGGIGGEVGSDGMIVLHKGVKDHCAAKIAVAAKTPWCLPPPAGALF